MENFQACMQSNNFAVYILLRSEIYGSKQCSTYTVGCTSSYSPPFQSR